MIEWMVTSSALILLVLLLRVLIKGRVSPRLRYALWGLVLLRLLIPGTIWESRASVMTPVAVQEGYQAVERIPRYVRTRPDGWLEIGHESGTTAIPEERTQSGEPVRYGWPPAKADLETLREQVSLRNALLLAWLAGAVLVGGFLLAVNLKFSGGLRKKRRTLERYRDLWVFAMEGLATPCLFGLFRPGIYLTEDLKEGEKPHVLAHEYTHFRQGDHIWAVLRGVCLALHWYNPLVWLAAVLSRRDCELSCDEGAVRLLGEEYRADYGRTLVGLVARRTTPADLACCATTMTGGKSALRERIALLVKQPRTTAVMACAVAAACAAFAVCTFTGAAEAEDIPDGPALENPAAEPDELPEKLPEDVTLLPLPENLPTELMDPDRPAEEQGEWLLLARWPEGDVALYRTGSDDSRVYLRWGEEFQMFEQDLSKLDMLPEIEKTSYGEGWGVSVWYKRHEGTYFNGETYVPGVVAECVLYGREDGYWRADHFSSSGRLEPELPALEDLPTALNPDIPGAYMAPIQLLAELPEEDIAIYYDRESFYPGSLIRYGDHLQRVWETLEGRNPPELYFEDLDGDGEKELAVIYNAGWGTGSYIAELVVYEWDGGSWTAHNADLEQGIIADFNANHTLTIYPDEGRAVVGCNGSEIAVDMSARFGNRALWAGEGTVCELQEMMYSYSMESYGLSLKIGGEIRPEGYPPASSYAFDYICNIYYEADGTFRSTWGYLDTGYGWTPKADTEQMTDTFQQILQQFINECRQTTAGGEEDISHNFFAICDVNGDGRNELITQRAGAAMAGQVERVYDEYGREILSEYPLITYYDNGYAKADWSHNQGKSGDKLWPYTLYRTTGTGRDRQYIQTAVIDGWDKSLGDRYLSYTGEYIPYPDEADKDGDGFVYYLITENGGYAPEYGSPMDYAEYAQWAAAFLGANVVKPAYFPLTEENIALIEQN